MRHRVKGRKLGRTKAHREATLRALGSALIKEHRIQTTLPKAKELRTFIEPLITVAKVDNTHNRRKVFSYLQDKVAVTELFNEVGPAAADRPGGYTRVLKLGHRLGDSADMAVIELVDYNDVQPESKSQKKRRTRRGGGSAGVSKAVVKEDKNAGKEPEEQETTIEEAVQSAETDAVPEEGLADAQKGNVDDSVPSESEEDGSDAAATGSEHSDSTEEEDSSEEKENSDK